jgi:hypothetical protein
MKARIGQFFLLIGVLCLALFFASDQGQALRVEFFVVGALLTGLGGYLYVRFRQAPPQADRFRFIRKSRQKAAERKAQKAAKKAAPPAKK